MSLFEEFFNKEYFFNRGDLLKCSDKGIDPVLQEKRNEVFSKLNRPAWESVLDRFLKLETSNEGGFSVKDGALLTGKSELSDPELEMLLKDLIPWRKGPWNICGNYIDAEWRSDIKYNGISPTIRDNPGAYVLDIGSGNGYYGFRALDDGASSVICIDPSEKHFFQFELFQKYAKDQRIQYEILGYEEAPLLPMKFDIVLCMGVLYHQKNPFYVMECAKNSLKKGGILLLESMTYPGEESISFMPPGRYAKARNVYYLPTLTALVSLCKRAGFSDINIINERRTSSEEQRQSEYAPFESLADFLDPEDESKTIEGYPAPQRALLSAKL